MFTSSRWPSPSSGGRPRLEGALHHVHDRTTSSAGQDRSREERGLPYLKGGICEVGGTLLLFDEIGVYTAAPNSWERPTRS